MHHILIDSLYLNLNHIHISFYVPRNFCSCCYRHLFPIIETVFNAEVPHYSDYLMLMVYFSLYSCLLSSKLLKI